ncbi:Hpt domain-containing protein [Indioceanicola profundi]|uniref:Hpt domain-containing protein n=1 Tax=Indioceanicola profundi TaxID=2220096 RepID=UPI0013C4FF8A|nr:Hpt domain-containing protein [Indioceanicola profundi]
MSMSSPSSTQSALTGSPAAEILDRSVLDQHLEILGSECVAGIIAKFLDTVPETVNQIVQAARDGDLKTLGAQSHKLGSGAVTLGLPALTELSRSVERLAKGGEAEAAIAAATGIAAAVEDAFGALRAVLADLPA